jgi:YD repeat-containing protein
MTCCSADTIFIYDALSRLTHVDYGNGQTVDYSYDSAGNRLTGVVFSPNSVTITTAVAPVANGSVSGGGAQAIGSTVTVSAIPTVGGHFVNWTESGVAVSNLPNYSFTATVSRSLVANFAAGGASSLAITPSQLDFSNQPIGTVSSFQSIAIINTGTTVLNIGNVAINGDFGESGNCGSPLSQGASCSIIVAFTPTGAGTRLGTLSFTSNATGSPFSVSLTGTGAALSQTIIFGPASLISVGLSRALSATGGGSGNPVSFLSLTTSVCTVAGTTVTGAAVGTCTIAANQAGNATYTAAPTATQSFSVGVGVGSGNPDGDVPLPPWSLVALAAGLLFSVCQKRRSN